MEKTNIRLAVIGVGRWGKNVLRTIEHEMDHTQLTHIVSGNPQVGDAYAERVTVLDNWRDLVPLKHQFDAAVAAVPPDVNLELVEGFCSAGIPLFIEKPIALDFATAQRILAIVKKHQAIIHVDHIDLYNPAVVEIANRLNNEPLDIEGAIGAAYPHHPVMRPLWEYSPHFIAATLKLVQSSVTALKATYLPIPKALQDQEKRELVQLELRFANGSHARLLAGNGMLDKTRRLKVTQSKTVYQFLDRAEVPLSINNEAIDIDKTLPLNKSIAHFVDKVRKNDNDAADFSSGIQVIHILELADKSLLQGRELTL